MKTVLLIASTTLLLLFSCHEKEADVSLDPIKWSARKATTTHLDSLQHGTSYLSVYSEVYSESEHKTHDLTVTVGLRNTSRKDTIYIKKAQYYGTKGHLLRDYFIHPVYIAPMETVEIVINETDKDGGTGANFMFDWSIKPGTNKPLFEAVMISTSGQQGISFTTHGKEIL